MFVKYFSADGCFVETIILLTVMRTMMLFPDNRALTFTKQPMKRNFT